MILPRRRYWNLLIAVSAIISIALQEAELTIPYSIGKALTTILVILLPILYVENGFKRYRSVIIAGLVFCLIGDVLLLSDDYFLHGLGSFLIGHIIFIYGYSTVGGFKWYPLPFIGLAIMNALVYYFILSDLDSLRIPVLLYTAIISIMAWQAISLYTYRSNEAFLFLAMGAVAFIISDGFIAVRMFARTFELSGVYILSTYWTAIALIANSTINNKEVI